MTEEQQQELLRALQHGRKGDDEFDLILAADIESIEPLVDRWIEEAYERGVKDAT